MRDKILYVLGAVTIAILVWNIYTIAFLPEETQQGVVFKIIFFHVPVAITAMLCAFAALVASVLFLITRNFKYDGAAVAVTEVGLAFLAANLVTGSIWGRQIWGIWWTWDARLTSALVCWLLYAGYLMLAGHDQARRQARVRRQRCQGHSLCQHRRQERVDRNRSQQAASWQVRTEPEHAFPEQVKTSPSKYFVSAPNHRSR